MKVQVHPKKLRLAKKATSAACSEHHSPPLVLFEVVTAQAAAPGWMLSSNFVVAEVTVLSP